MHYTRWWKTGEVGEAESRTDFTAATFERLVLIETDEHVPWPYPLITGGYGRARINGQDITVHRAALERRVGPCPPGMEACHTPGIGCDRSCMNYRHLRWDTPKNNSADMRIDGTLALGEEHPNSKLTESDVRLILAAPKSRSHASLARQFGVSEMTVRRIRARTSWVHVSS
jgi:hypothetical protein